jgi:hypothetical protein
LFDLNELVMPAERLLHRVLGEDIELLVSANKPVWGSITSGACSTRVPRRAGVRD